MGYPDQAHTETTTLEQAAAQASAIADTIDALRRALLPTVAALRGWWDGEAERAFEIKHAEWDQGVTRLVAALDNLGVSTGFSANTYLAADQTGAASVNAAQGAPFNGALA